MDAGGQPCSVSIISDLASREKRAGAVAIFYAGVPLGMLLGFMGGGLIAANYGWRTGFFVAAVPGLLLAALLWFTVQEPARGATEQASAEPAQSAPSLGESLRFMLGQPSLRLVILGSILVTSTSSAMMSWIGSLLIRTHQLSLPEVGIMTSLCMGGFGAIGTVYFGRLADRLGAQSMRWQPRLMAAGAVQQIADVVVPRLLADTAFQTRVGTAAGNAAVASLKTPAMIAAGALAVGALALVWMATTRATRSNPSRRSYR